MWSEYLSAPYLVYAKLCRRVGTAHFSFPICKNFASSFTPLSSTPLMPGNGAPRGHQMAVFDYPQGNIATYLLLKSRLYAYTARKGGGFSGWLFRPHVPPPRAELCPLVVAERTSLEIRNADHPPNAPDLTAGHPNTYTWLPASLDKTEETAEYGLSKTRSCDIRNRSRGTR